MINVRRLQELLNNTTIILSKGPVTKQYLSHLGIGDALIDGFVLVEEWSDHVVDCQILSIGVALDQASRFYAEFEELLTQGFPAEVLREGPSFQYFTGYVGSQLNAFRLLALGSALGLWSVITPKDLELPQSIQNEAAVMGMVLMSGYPRGVFSEARQAVG